MKKIISILLIIMTLTACNFSNKSKFMMSTDTGITDQNKLQTYQAIIPDLKFYKAKVPENAISYKLSIVRVKNGKIDEKNTSSFSGDFKYIKNFSKNSFSFAGGLLENEFIFSLGNGDISSIKPNANVGKKEAKAISFNKEFEKIELNKDYILMQVDYFPSSKGTKTIDVKTLDEFEGKADHEADHEYYLMCLKFMDKSLEVN